MPKTGDSKDEVPARSLRPVAVTLGVASTVAAAAFALAAWVPTSHPPFTVLEGAFVVGFGLVVLALPLLAAALAVTARQWAIRVLIGVPLVAVAIFVGFIWSSVVLASRNPSWSLH